MTVLAALAGALVLAGFGLIASGARSRVADPRRDRRSGLRRGLRASDFEAAVAASGAAVVVLVVTRWPVAAIGAGVGSWFVPDLIRRRSRRDGEARTDAIALWAEMLRDAIGTARGIEGVLVATAPTAPLPIRPEVQRMAARLESQSLGAALERLGVELAHPVGDLVVSALRLTATAGTREVRSLLADLATAAYAEAESQRRIEVARERPRAAMRYTAAVIAAFVVGLVVFAGDYLAPYESAVGQVVLLFVAAYWVAGFWWMQRMGRLSPVERFLAVPERDVLRSAT